MRPSKDASFSPRPSRSLIRIISLLMLFITVFGPARAEAWVDDQPTLNVDPLRKRQPELSSGQYQPDFVGVDRSIIGRASDDGKITSLTNNQPYQGSITAGQTKYFTFPKDAVLGPKSPQPSNVPPGRRLHIARDPGEDKDEHGLKKRQGGQSGATVFVSLDTCSQPLPSSGKRDGGAPDQLKVYVSTSSGNQKPNSNHNNNKDGDQITDGGHSQGSVTASDALYVAVEAPASSGFTGNYTFQLALSIDDYFSNLQDLHYNVSTVDTGSTNGLFYAGNSSNISTDMDALNGWMSTSPFGLYVFSLNDPSVLGLQNSQCALNASQIRIPSSNIRSDTFMAHDGGLRQRFFVQGLNGSASYGATLVFNGSSTPPGGAGVNGGGIVFNTTTLKTKSGELR